MKKLFAFAGAALCGVAWGRAPLPDPAELAKLVESDMAAPVRPGGVEGRAFWNVNSQWFMYPPAFDFAAVKGAVQYRFTVVDDRQHQHAFFAPSPKAALTPVWGAVPVGFFTVLCEGLDAASNSVGLARLPCGVGAPSYWKLARFEPGKCPAGRRGYLEAARMVYDHVFELPSTQHFLKKGVPDPGYILNCYPAKIHSALGVGMIRYARLRPERAKDAIGLARLAADWLLAESEPADAPLAHFPPTYETRDGYRNWTAQKYAGQTMLLYPAVAGSFFLKLAAETGEAKYRTAAIRIAETYLRLQGEDGTWPLKLWLRDGRPVSPNRAFPLGIAGFLERVFAVTGEARFRAAADRAAAWVDRGPMRSYNWEGQFEDVEPTSRYVNLTKHPPCEAAIHFLRRHPGDAHRLAEARELARFAEDQFVLWERPCRADGTGIRTGRPWYSPGDVTVDYLGWLAFPSATEQYHWNIPIDASSAKLIRTWLALYRAGGNPLDLAKARAFGDALTRVQLPGGRIPTQMAEYNLKDPGQDWINCMLAAASALEELAAACGETSAADLEAGFRNPPPDAKPRVWWHWMNGNVTKAGITADLEAMAAAGIGGAHLFDVGCDVPPGPVKFGTPDWDDHVRWAAKEAERLGLEITLANCSGYTSSGGPWVKPEDAQKTVVCSETRVAGGETPAALPKPEHPGVEDFYRDVAVVAFPLPAAERAGAAVRLVQKETAKNTFTVEADRPYTACGFTLSITYDVYQWTQPVEALVETSEDGANWREACRVKSSCVSEGICDCHASRGEKKLFALPAPVTARRFRVAFAFPGHDAPGAEPVNFEVKHFALDARTSLAEMNRRAYVQRGPVPPTPGPVGPDRVVPADAIVDLTDKFDPATGRLAWTAPAGGPWAVVRAGYTRTDARCGPASATGGGWEVDKLDAAAVARHFDAYVGRFAALPAVRGALVDSYEVGCQNWTHGLERIYAKRFGRSFLPYLVCFTGRIVGGVEESERAFADLRRLVADLFAENYAGELRRKCHAAGLELAVEPYGNSPADDTSYAMNADLPMTEFWTTPNTGCDWPVSKMSGARVVASAAHFWGRRHVDAEAFTAAPHHGGRWTKDPFGLKATGDFMYAAGVTRMVYHRWAQQPWTQPARLPGMTMGQWGTHFERTETWWPMVGPWLKYQARCQYLLSQGRSAADLLYYAGDAAPNNGHPEKPSEKLAWDVVGKDGLAAVRRDGAFWVAPSGARYRRLVMPGEGAGDEGIEPDFTAAGFAPLHAIRRIYDDGTEGYFVAHSATNAAADVVCSFRQRTRVPEIWDPETGRVFAPKAWRRAGGRTEVTIDFKPCGAVFVMFREERVGATPRPVLRPAKTVATAELAGPWRLKFPAGWGCPAETNLLRLVSWTALGGETRYFSGVAEYAADGAAALAALGERKGRRVVLELGDVRNCAIVAVNGRTFEPLWRPPYEVDVTEAVGAGADFALAVQVANLWPNRLIGDAKKPEDREYCDEPWRPKALKAIPEWVKADKPSPTGRYTFTTWRHYLGDEPLLPSGLLGPVRLRTER